MDLGLWKAPGALKQRESYRVWDRPPMRDLAAHLGVLIPIGWRCQKLSAPISRSAPARGAGLLEDAYRLLFCAAALYQEFLSIGPTPHEMHPRGYPGPIVEGPGHAIRLQGDAVPSSLQRWYCCRSSCPPPSGEYYATNARLFHTGRRYGIEVSCSVTSANQPGCQLSESHVCGERPRGKCHTPARDTVSTRPLLPCVASGVFALDCAMSFTIRGFEVTEVSYTAWNATTAYCACLRTQRPRLERDLRRVTAEHIGHARTTLQDVQAVLHHLFAISVVLVGPGWEIYGRRFERGQCTVEDAGRCLQPWRSLEPVDRTDGSAKACMDLVLSKAFSDVKLNDAATKSPGDSPPGRH
ncbi:RNA exonuclease 1 homolog [Haemaphysalis longicornis]